MDIDEKQQGVFFLYDLKTSEYVAGPFLEDEDIDSYSYPRIGDEVFSLEVEDDDDDDDENNIIAGKVVSIDISDDLSGRAYVVLTECRGVEGIPENGFPLYGVKANLDKCAWVDGDGCIKIVSRETKYYSIIKSLIRAGLWLEKVDT